MLIKLNKLALCLTLAAMLNPLYASEVTEVTANDNKPDKRLLLEQELPIYVNQVLKPYTLLKKLSSEVYVTDAKSEEEAELLALQLLRNKAKENGADGLIEVRRSIIKDNMALRSNSASATLSSSDDSYDTTSVAIDEMTLEDYNRNKGTLSTTLIDGTFDRAKLSQKAIRFTGKAIKFD